jgi:hypothetical protein
LKSLVELGVKDIWFSDKIDSFVGQYKEKDGFTPKQILVVLKAFNRHAIEYRTTDFRVKIKRHIWRDQIAEGMSAGEREIIWGSLSLPQQNAITKRMADLARWERQQAVTRNGSERDIL